MRSHMIKYYMEERGKEWNEIKASVSKEKADMDDKK